MRKKLGNRCFRVFGRINRKDRVSLEISWFLWAEGLLENEVIEKSRVKKGRDFRLN